MTEQFCPLYYIIILLSLRILNNYIINSNF